MGIKVKALKHGLFGHYRNPGDVFEIQKEKQFSSKWMAKVEAEKGSKSSKVAAEEAEAEVESGSDQSVI